MADQRLSIYSKNGYLLDRISASFSFTESLNDYGQAEFTMARTDPKCTEENLSFGNYVLFEHARLGKWAGIIAPHNGQDWNDDGTITTRCLSVEYNFWRRRAPLHDFNYNDVGAAQGTEGQLLILLIRYANMNQDTLMRKGQIYLGGVVRRLKLRYALLGDLLTQLLDASDMQFWCAPYLDQDGRLQFAVNYLPRRGRDLGYQLRERINMELPSGSHYRRDAALVNDVLVLAESGDAPLKPTGYAVSKASLAKYGLWEGTDSVESDNQIVAQERAFQIIRDDGTPIDRDKVVAIETPESPDTFSFIGLGDSVTVHKDSVGFYNAKRSYSRLAYIVAREYDNDTKKCILTLARSTDEVES